MQNFRAGKNSFTDIYHINIYLAKPYYVPGITLDIVEAKVTQSLLCLKFHNLQGVCVCVCVCARTHACGVNAGVGRVSCQQRTGI